MQNFFTTCRVLGNLFYQQQWQLHLHSRETDPSGLTILLKWLWNLQAPNHGETATNTPSLTNQSQVSQAHANTLPIFSNSSSSLPVAGALSTKSHHTASLRHTFCSGYKADRHRNKANRDRFRVINCNGIRKPDYIERAPKQGSCVSMTSGKTNKIIKKKL